METTTARELDDRPKIAITLGDVAGIGPEILTKAWPQTRLHQVCQPVVIGSPEVLRRQIHEAQLDLTVDAMSEWRPSTPSVRRIPCLDGSRTKVHALAPGMVHAAAGQAAFDYLATGIHLALAGEVDALVTLPLHKEGLHAAGLPYPGHTEILAEKTGTTQYGMMLYRRGLGVMHVTLHMALREALNRLTTQEIGEKIRLLEDMMKQLGTPTPRIGVASVNPHASDGGIFGNEEAQIIRPAVEQARTSGIVCSGPWPADTLFARAKDGEFDGVVAMYHDQGHIALKVMGWREAVNVTVGLPLVRTSVAHGTAYDIVGQGKADPTSLYEAVDVAAKLARRRRQTGSGA